MTDKQKLASSNNRIYRRLRKAGLDYDTLKNNKVIVILRGAQVVASAPYLWFESPHWIKTLSRLADAAIRQTTNTRKDT